RLRNRLLSWILRVGKSREEPCPTACPPATVHSLGRRFSPNARILLELGTCMEALTENDVQAIGQLRDVYARLRKELGRVIVGQQDTVERLAICLFARGHALL